MRRLAAAALRTHVRHGAHIRFVTRIATPSGRGHNTAVVLMTPLPETIARIRQQYADGVPVAQISVDNKVNKSTVYRWVDGGGVGRRARTSPQSM
jgi:hypothetical protein